MRDFKLADFEGSGQYLVACKGGDEKYTDTGLLATVMQKVGYASGQKLESKTPKLPNAILMDMSDGFTYLGYHDTTNDPDYETRGVANPKLWEYVRFEGTQVLVDYLNNPALCTQEMRFATHEEVMRVVLNQSNKCR